MIYSNNRLSQEQLQQNSLLLSNKEAKMIDFNDKLLLPSSTRSLKRRTSLFEKSRDWARRLITLHRPRRNTISNEKFHETSYELNKTPSTTKSNSSLLHNYQKSFDEDGYLSPLEIKAKLDDITQENHHQSHSKLSTNSEQLFQNSNPSPLIYRYHDPNIQTKSFQREKRLPTTSFVSEYQKSLSIVDYIDFDVQDELSKQDNNNDDPLESLKYLFNNNSKQQGTISRRIPRRSTNASSISTDSGYSDIPILSTSKFIPLHLISCSLVPVNVRCLTCTCPPSSSSATCLSHQRERKFYSHSSRSNFFRPPLSYMNRTENGLNNQCECDTKYYSTMTIYPSTKSTKSITKIDDQKENYYYSKRPLKKKRPSLLRHPTITDDLISISRWYKPYLDRQAICNVLQQADYGTFILRNSTTHSDCYALSIKVPKFTHDSNIVHYLIEKTIANDSPSYRIKGTIKQFPTLLSLLTHHSVMPEILPITLNLNESFTI